MSSNTSTSELSITSLAHQISQLSAQISHHFTSSSQPEPTFSASSTGVPETPEYEALRAQVNDAALDLLRLVNGPKSTLRSLFFSQYDLAALQVALDRKFFNHVPLPSAVSGGKSENGQEIAPEASAAEIADKAGMDEDRTARVLRLLATHRIFEEVDGETGRFRHTANSALFARDEGWNATADMQMDDMFKAASETSSLIARSPHTSDTQHCAFLARFGVPMYLYYEQNPQKGTRFAQAMSSWSQSDREISQLQDAFHWESLKNGTVVDIGGGSGHISIALARVSSQFTPSPTSSPSSQTRKRAKPDPDSPQHFHSLNFIVQDISNHQLDQAQSTALHDLGRRLTFQQHDFFTPQPEQPANVFLLRQCLHNYNDADCVKILRGVVSALERCEPGTPLLINDVVLPESGTTTRFEERYLRQLDITMLVALGAKQRSEREFNTLLKEADPRFELVDVKINTLGLGLLEVHLNTK